MDFAKYEHTLTYPSRPQKPQLPTGKATETGTAFREYADKLDKYAKQGELYEKQVQEYNAETAEIYGKFKVDALKETGLWGHEAGNRAFEFVWNRQGNFNDAFYMLCDLAEVILGPR